VTIRSTAPLRLIVVSGLPGTGKSTLAGAIGAALTGPVLSVDPIEGAIAAAGIPRSFETGLAAYLVAEELADAFLAAGLTVVIDAVSGVEPARKLWRDLAARRGAALRVIVCEALDRDLIAARLTGRQRDTRLVEPTATELAARRAEWADWPEPHLRLDTGLPAQALLAKALAWLSSGSGVQNSLT
jgi:predicted kinase